MPDSSAAPMLVKLAPAPERRVLGDLHDPALLRGALGLLEVHHG